MRLWPSPLVMMVLLMAVLGCRPDLSREKAAVESLMPIIDNVMERLARMDTATAQKMAEQLRFQCERMQQDSMAVNGHSDHLDIVCQLPEKFDLLIERRRELVQESQNTLHQLRLLHSDLNNMVANKDSAAAFIETEFLFVEHLGELTEEVEDEIEKCLESAELNRPFMDSLMTVVTAKFVE